MAFLNPLVLFGLIAAGIPVLIHLLQLKKLRQVEFSSIRFLKEIQHASARRVKLRDYILLILRTLAIAALVMAFSRPVLRGFLGSNAKTSSVIIVDDSPSTTARNEYGEISSQIRSVASSLLNSFHAGDDASLIFTSSPADTTQGISRSDPMALSARVTRSEPS
ncbi:MAG TPA: BatA domain-containing protein, partial [Candidatus Kryptobacter bacterium]|nr:BatA domain-containing protein [Candidatus Kryptobacter bacterium]